MNGKLTHTYIECKDGLWRVLRRGRRICIVDPKGRERHRSTGHDMTAVHLAMLIAERPMPSSKSLDQVLRASARKFAKGNDLGLEKLAVKMEEQQ